MNRQEHLLTIIMEECAEVAQRASKALRFGLTEIQPDQDLSNAERVMVEFDDLLAAIQMCQDANLLPSRSPERMAAKMAKVEKFLVYSEQQGTLKAAFDDVVSKAQRKLLDRAADIMTYPYPTESLTAKWLAAAKEIEIEPCPF